MIDGRGLWVGATVIKLFHIRDGGVVRKVLVKTPKSEFVPIVLL